MVFFDLWAFGYGIVIYFLGFNKTKDLLASYLVVGCGIHNLTLTIPILVGFSMIYGREAPIAFSLNRIKVWCYLRMLVYLLITIASSINTWYFFLKVKHIVVKNSSDFDEHYDLDEKVFYVSLQGTFVFTALIGLLSIIQVRQILKLKTWPSK